MEQLHFHCQNCTRDKIFFNINCIEEVKKHVDSNLYTIISYNTCDNCNELLNELDVDNYCNVLRSYSKKRIKIYNLKLIDQYGFFNCGFFWGNSILYQSYDTTTNNWTKIDKNIMFDTIKDGSLIKMCASCLLYNISDIERELEEIKDKGYEVNFIQTEGEYEVQYYIVKKKH